MGFQLERWITDALNKISENPEINIATLIHSH
jgi:hypothetical protein